MASLTQKKLRGHGHWIFRFVGADNFAFIMCVDLDCLLIDTNFNAMLGDHWQWGIATYMFSEMFFNRKSANKYSCGDAVCAMKKI